MIKSLDDLQLKKGQRAIIVGRAGTGKSTLGKTLIPLTGKLCIIDPKREVNFPNCKIYDSADKILREKPKRFIYRPHESQFEDYAEYDKVFHYVYKSGDFFIFIDDLVAIVTATRFPYNLKMCYMLGRSKGITALACTQRPAFLPGYMITECNNMYVFDLHNERDRKKMNDIGPYDPKKITDEHTFAFFSCSNDRTYYLKLKLEGM